MAEEVENVKVAVRVRPFNKRELDRKSKLIVRMNGNVTTIENPDEDEKARSFTYDYSYWSFDGCRQRSNGYLTADSNHANGKIYADQVRVYKDLGKGILKNAWAGYNATLFAYGQTGSGKSWSVIGYETNKGIVPLVCEELFQGIKENKEEKAFEVKFSMLEIYNEIVRDLLKPNAKRSGLKIRQHPKKGFYAEGLSNVLVTSNQDIANKMDEGTRNRTIRATNMNATSSRAHTIVAVTFIQKFKNNRGVDTAKSAIINLVDLAGSERVESTGAVGDRLKEGAAINMSLTCLGNCINALVKIGQGEKVRIPYRDSALTKLLKNALGGNSKTVMIAAISPADINHAETVSTLNFADRAKQIKTKAVVNEDPTEKLIKELKSENERLKLMMQSGKVDADFLDEDGDGVDDRVHAKVREELEEEMKLRMAENEAEVANMKKSYEEKLNAAKAATSAQDEEHKKLEKQKKTMPHIKNLNMDPSLSGKVIQIINKGSTTIGNTKGKESDITMLGPGIQADHAEITLEENGKVNIKPNTTDSRLLVNGTPILGVTILNHNDWLMFGSTQMWVFVDPMDKNAKNKKITPITYEYALEQLAIKSGVDIQGLSDSENYNDLNEELAGVVSAVMEANSISEELDKKAKFDMLLVAPNMYGNNSGKTEVRIRLRNLANETEFIWDKQKFYNRLDLMRDVYAKFESEQDDGWDDEDESDDPFMESLDTEVHIGQVEVILKPLSHRLESKDQLEIRNLKGNEVGYLNFELTPCSKSGREYTEKDDMFVDKPEELIGQELNFKFKILDCRGLPNRYANVYCCYSFYLDDGDFCTPKIEGTINPNFNHSKQFNNKPVTRQLVEYLKNERITIEVKGIQRIRRSAIPKTQGMTTKEMLKDDKRVFSSTGMMGGGQMNGKVVDPQKQSILVELLLMKKTQARLQQRVDNVAKLLKEAENTSRLRISTTLLREVMNAPTEDQADSLIRGRLQGESDGLHGHTESFTKSSVCILL